MVLVFILAPTWNISAFSPSLSAKFLKEKDKFLRAGVEWYFTKGVTSAHRWISQSQYKEIEFITTGMAPGCFVGAGISPSLTSCLRLDVSITGRFGWVWNSSYTMKKDVVKASSAIWHQFTGLYLNLGIKYRLNVGGVG